MLGPLLFIIYMNDLPNVICHSHLHQFADDIAMYTSSTDPVSVRLEPIMLKSLPIIPSRTSQKFYPLFLIYSQIITYYSFIIILSILLSQ